MPVFAKVVVLGSMPIFAKVVVAGLHAIFRTRLPLAVSPRLASSRAQSALAKQSKRPSARQPMPHAAQRAHAQLKRTASHTGKNQNPRKKLVATRSRTLHATLRPCCTNRLSWVAFLWGLHSTPYLIGVDREKYLINDSLVSTIMS